MFGFKINTYTSHFHPFGGRILHGSAWSVYFISINLQLLMMMRPSSLRIAVAEYLH